MQNTKPRLITKSKSQSKTQQERKNTITQNKHNKLKTGLVASDASYDIRPGNGANLFWKVRDR